MITWYSGTKRGAYSRMDGSKKKTTTRQAIRRKLPEATQSRIMKAFEFREADPANILKTCGVCRTAACRLQSKMRSRFLQ